MDSWFVAGAERVVVLEAGCRIAAIDLVGMHCQWGTAAAVVGLVEDHSLQIRLPSTDFAMAEAAAAVAVVVD